jgi:pSer/pThr/pTyr-binding forkhead associated (FHA) protein
MPVTVVVRTSARDRPSLTFDGARVVIGRSSGCDVRLPDPSVSLRHASIRAQGAEYSIVDEGSTNGTWLGKTRLAAQTPQIIRSGDLVRIGRVWLEIIIDQKPATPDLGAATRDLAHALVRNAMSQLGDGTTVILHVTQGRDAGAELRLEEEGRLYTIGRGDACDLPLSDEDTSREHAAFIRRGSQILVRDLGSTNGIYLGEQRVSPDRDVVWRPSIPATLGRTLLDLDDPVARALTDLESLPDEPLREVDAPAPPDTPPAPATEAPAPPKPAPAPKPTPAPPTRRVWTTADISVVILAVVVISVSAAGLAWVLR